MRKVLITFFVLALLFPSFNAQAVTKCFQVDTGKTLTTSLTSYWQMEDATDYWSTYNFTNNGSVTFTAGKVNNASTYNGTNDLTNASTTFDFSKTNAFSISFWENQNSGTNTQIMVNKGNYDTNQYGYHVSFASDATIIFTLDDQSGNFIGKRTTGTFSRSAFHHIVVTYDGSNTLAGIKINVDGSAATANNFNNVTSLTGDMTGSGNPLDIGNDASGAYKFHGQIDELSIWTKVLSSTEITDLYNSGSGQTMTTSCGGGVVRHRRPILIQ